MRFEYWDTLIMGRPNVSAKDVLEAEKRLLEKYRRTKDPKVIMVISKPKMI